LTFLKAPLAFISTPLGRYRVLAYIVGVGLATLVFVGMPLQYWAHSPAVAKYVGTAHGLLYIVYLLACIDLGARYRFGWKRLLALVSAGFVPFVSFVAERKTTAFVRSRDRASAERATVATRTG
jgi:integral membrane protein